MKGMKMKKINENYFNLTQEENEQLTNEIDGFEIPILFLDKQRDELRISLTKLVFVKLFEKLIKKLPVTVPVIIVSDEGTLIVTRVKESVFITVREV